MLYWKKITFVDVGAVFLARKGGKNETGALVEDFAAA